MPLFGLGAKPEEPLPPPREPIFAAGVARRNYPKYGNSLTNHVLGNIEVQSNAGIIPFTIPDIAHATISLIVNRAMQARLMPGPGTKRSLTIDIAPDYTRRRFYASIYQAYLSFGNVLLFRDRGATGGLRFGVNITRMPNGWRCSEFVLREGNHEFREVAFDDGILLAWDKAQGQAILGASPLDMASPAIASYQKAVDLLHDYARNAHRVGQHLTGTAPKDPDHMEATADKFVEQMERPGSFIPSTSEPLMDVKNGGQFTLPILEDALNQAVKAVARIWQVPDELLNVTTRGVAQREHELEMKLLESAVRPMLDDFADALTRLFNVEISFDMSMLGLPSIMERAEASLKLAQGGTLTINEIRRITGDGPLELGDDIGDQFPTTAGSANREDEKPAGSTPPAA